MLLMGSGVVRKARSLLLMHACKRCLDDNKKRHTLMQAISRWHRRLHIHSKPSPRLLKHHCVRLCMSRPALTSRHTCLAGSLLYFT